MHDITVEGYEVAKSVLELLFRYFRTVHPLKMAWHLIWIMAVLAMLSITYIVSFHFLPVMELWQRSRSFDHFRTELSTSVAVDHQVNTELQQVLQRTHADRAYVFRYHNGIPAVGGVPFIFHTNTHEVIRPGVNRVISLMQRIPSSINVHMNQEFIQNRCVTLNDLDLDTTGHDYWYYQSRGSIHLVRCAFYTTQGDLLGFVGLDYVNRSNPVSLDQVSSQLRESAQRLGIMFQRSP